MKGINRIGLGIVLVLVVLGSFFSINHYLSNKNIEAYRVYEGRVYLEESKYEDFKRFLADNPKIEIVKLEVLSSPNALIDFSFQTPPRMEIPYGEPTIQYVADISVLVVSLGVCLALGIVLWEFLAIWSWWMS